MSNRKTVLVDLDNVVYPWVEAMAHLVVREGLTSAHPLELIALYKSWAVWDDWAVPKGGFDRVWESAIESGDMYGVTDAVTAHAIGRATPALWQLSDREWHIHFVTDRLNKFRLHDKAVMSTAAWLSWANLPYRSLTFTKDKSAISADVIIDDNPDNLLAHPAPTKILFPAPHNQQWRDENPDTDIHVLQSGEGLWPWDEIVEMLGDGLRNSDDG